jgi:hypothetical protein
LHFCEDIVVYRHLACKQQAALLSFDLILMKSNVRPASKKPV